MSAPSLDVRLELVEITREILDHARPGAAALFAENLDVLDLVPSIDADLTQQSGGRVEGALKVGVSKIPAGSVPESSSWTVQPTHDPTPRASAVAMCMTRGIVVESRTRLRSSMQVHETTGIRRHEDRRAAGKLVVRHGDGYLRLPDREGAAESTAEVGARKRANRGARRQEKPPRRVPYPKLPEHVA